VIRSIILFLVVISLNAFACSCINETTEEYFSDSSKVALGRIMKMEIVFDEQEAPFQKITLDTSNNFKGEFNNVIFSKLDGNRCDGIFFMLGREYLVFLDQNNWVTGTCGGTQEILPNNQEHQKVIKKVKKLSPNKKINKDT